MNRKVMVQRTSLKSSLPLYAIAAVCIVLCPSAPTQAQTLTLSVDDAVQRALTHNPALRISKATLDEMSATSWQATTTLLPRLDLTGRYVKTDPEFFPEQANFITETQYSAQLRASHNVISGGNTLGLVQSAWGLASAAKHDHRATRLQIMHAVKSAFYDVLLAQRLVEVADEAVAINEEELRRVKVQFEIGEAAKINVLRAEVQLANSIPDKLNARHNLRIAKSTLANMIAFDVADTDGDVASLQLTGELETNRRLVLPELARLLSAAHSNRSELQSARSSVSVAKGESRSSWSGVLPRVDVYGAYTWSSSENKLRIIDSTGVVVGNVPLDFDLNGWEVGATASMPLFDFFGNVKGVQAGRAKVRRAEIIEEDTRRLIDLEVRSAYSSYSESIEAVNSQDKNVERARESLRLARQSQAAGEATQLDVQEAQLDLTQAQSLAAQANRGLLVAESLLLTSIGIETMEDAARYGVIAVE